MASASWRHREETPSCSEIQGTLPAKDGFDGFFCLHRRLSSAQGLGTRDHHLYVDALQEDGFRQEKHGKSLW